jgi:alcohol dehydrogenase class IV
MNNLELLLRKHVNNFHFSDNITNDNKIDYLNSRNIVTVTDSNLVKVSSIQEIINFFKEKLNSKLIVLDSMEPNYEMIESTAKEIVTSKYDLVIALGGGSILDVVKASSVYENAFEKVDNFAGSKKQYTKKTLKTLAIPTTAGTGSEFTNTSVYKSETNIKTWLWDELTYFDYVLYSPSLTLDLSKNITIASGVDALSHLLESLMSIKFDSQNLDLCNSGIKSIWFSLPKLIEDKKNIVERTNMLLASGIAGKAIHYTGCGICHCIAHTLGSMTKVSHGIAIAYGLYHTIEPTLQYNQGLLSRYKGIFENSTPDSLTQKIQNWLNNFKINFDIIENKINFDEFMKIYYLEDNKCMRDNTFYQATDSELKNLLKTLWK